MLRCNKQGEGSISNRKCLLFIRALKHTVDAQWAVSCSTEKFSQWPTRGIKTLANLWAPTLLSKSWTISPLGFFLTCTARENTIKRVTGRMSQRTPTVGMKEVSEIKQIWQCRSCSFKQKWLDNRDIQKGNSVTCF